MSQVAHSGEHGNSANDADGSVDESEEQYIADYGAVELVVRREGDDGTKCDADGIENLLKKLQQ